MELAFNIALVILSQIFRFGTLILFEKANFATPSLSITSKLPLDYSKLPGDMGASYL